MQKIISLAKKVVNHWNEFGPEPEYILEGVIDQLDEAIKECQGFPRIVCLCGSTRFWRTFQEAGLRETMTGRIVLSIGAASGTDDEHFGNLPREEYDRVKEMLDALHFRKIELADEVLILNVDSYVGLSTAREMNYALKLGKLVRFWEANGHRAEVRSQAELDAYICLGCRRLLHVAVGFTASVEPPAGYLIGGWYCGSCIRRGEQEAATRAGGG